MNTFTLLTGQHFTQKPQEMDLQFPFFNDFTNFITQKGWKTELRHPGNLLEQPIPKLAYRAHKTLFQPDEPLFDIYDASRNNDLKLFNSHPFIRLLGNKYEMFLQLKDKFPELLPKTELLSDYTPGQLQKLPPNTVIKAIKGFSGDEIYLLAELSPAQITTMYQNREQHLVQEFIDTYKVDGRALDIRFGLLKNDKEFQVIYQYSRLAAPNHFISNTNLGGHFFLTKDLPFSNKTLQAAQEKACQIAAHLEQASNSHGSLCSVDMTIDKNGKLYLFETNSDPGWSFLYKEYKDHFQKEEIMVKLLNRIQFLTNN